MYCTYCGAANPDNFRFCHACGKPRVPVNTLANSGVAVTAQRAALIRAAIEFCRRDDVKTPFDLVPPNMTSDLVRNLTPDEVGALVWPDRFLPEESQAFSGNTDALLTYIQMLETIAEIVAEQLDTRALLQGVFWLEATLVYRSSLNSLIENRAWAQVEHATSEYLDLARKTGSSLALLEPLVKHALAQLMLNKRQACKSLLDEFDRNIERAKNERLEYDFPQGQLRVGWITAQSDVARDLRSKVR